MYFTMQFMRPVMPCVPSKSQNAHVPYSIIHHTGTEIGPFLFPNAVLWDMGQVHLGIWYWSIHVRLSVTVAILQYIELKQASFIQICFSFALIVNDMHHINWDMKKWTPFGRQPFHVLFLSRKLYFNSY